MRDELPPSPATPGGGPWLPPAAILVAFAVTGLWVALTTRTGLTFHFYPGIIELAPVFMMRRLTNRPIGWPALMGLLATGAAAVAVGWAVLGVLGARPTATFIEGQFGGVQLEVAVFTLLGAAWATRMARRPVGRPSA